MEGEKPKVIIVTGTPGVGKTTVATELASTLSANLLSVSELVQKENLVTESDKERGTIIADMTRLRVRVRSIIGKAKKDIVIEGHYAYDIVPKALSPHIFVLRREPDDLELKLRNRAYNEKKVSENVAAEVLDVCLIGAMKRFGKDRLHEIDVTSMDVGMVVTEILVVLNGEKEAKSGRVDWIAKLEEKGTLEKFLSSIVRVEGVKYGHLANDSET
ncbi:adenylate kinase family protein [Candidatus Bathyarchaeota archaeon]|nr:adenylate kinase family protein [Candidatus Bathyarchaeota archaeon]